VTVQDSEISGNRAIATSGSGSATAQGAGIFNNNLLTLRRVVVRDNRGEAFGPEGAAQGGGIWNGEELSGPAELTLDLTSVTGNSLVASPGLDVKGGGLFTSSPVTRHQSPIRDNRPDNCDGVAC
jgi:hypothetical protein